MVVIHRFVTGGSVERTNPFVEGILTEGDDFVLVTTPEIPVHRFADQGSNAHPATLGCVTQLAVGLLREAQVSHDVTGHGGITISRYRLKRKGEILRICGPQDDAFGVIS
jgi:hypothetical protein